MSSARNHRLRTIRKLRKGIEATLPILDAGAKGEAVDPKAAWVAKDRASRALAEVESDLVEDGIAAADSRYPPSTEGAGESPGTVQPPLFEGAP